MKKKVVKSMTTLFVVIGIGIMLTGCRNTKQGVQAAAEKQKAYQEAQTSTETVEETQTYDNQDGTLSAEEMQNLLEEYAALEEADAEGYTPSTADTTVSGDVYEGYDVDIEADRKTFDAENIDIVVGDKFFATQINDWFENFDEYEGKRVEIEGFYVGDYYPWIYVGRYGPSCPYCRGNYVAFEMYTDIDTSTWITGENWLKIQGILRRGEDSYGEFYYLEVINMDVSQEHGMDTITN